MDYDTYVTLGEILALINKAPGTICQIDSLRDKTFTTTEIVLRLVIVSEAGRVPRHGKAKRKTK